MDTYFKPHVLLTIIKMDLPRSGKWRWGSVYLTLLACTLLLSGCNGVATDEYPLSETNRTETVTPERPSALADPLYGLVTADNRTAYADRRGLSYQNGSVRARIKLAENATLPRKFDFETESRAGNRVIATVPVDQLVPLAKHRNTTFVRAPIEARTY